MSERALCERLPRELARKLGEEVTVHGLWGPFPSGELRIWRAVYSYPAWRLATLEHWRDEGEWRLSGAVVVAMEASKVARLLLKDHAQLATDFVDPPVLADVYAQHLSSLARSLNGDPAERYALINEWLTALRKASGAF